MLEPTRKLIWLSVHGFTHIVSLLDSPHNLHAYGVAGLASVVGGIIAYVGLQRAMGALPYALAVAAAGFLYIAVAGLIPGLHRRADPRTSLGQVILIALGVGIIAWAQSLAHE